jgi:hypothetical protein
MLKIRLGHAHVYAAGGRRWEREENVTGPHAQIFSVIPRRCGRPRPARGVSPAHVFVSTAGSSACRQGLSYAPEGFQKHRESRKSSVVDDSIISLRQDSRKRQVRQHIPVKTGLLCTQHCRGWRPCCWRRLQQPFVCPDVEDWGEAEELARITGPAALPPGSIGQCSLWLACARQNPVVLSARCIAVCPSLD